MAAHRDAPDDDPTPRPSVVPPERPGRRGGKRDTNRLERTRALTGGALALFLVRGVEAVTIDDIVKAAGMAKGSFYRYFEGKTELVEAILAPLVAAVDEALAAAERALEAAASREPLLAAYQRLGLALAAAALAHPDAMRLYLQESRAPAAGARAPIAAVAARVGARAVALTEIAHAHGLLRPISPEVSALAVVGAAERLFHAHLAGELRTDAATVVRDLVSLVVDGLRR